jgi:hypothetical protein
MQLKGLESNPNTSYKELKVSSRAAESKEISTSGRIPAEESAVLRLKYCKSNLLLSVRHNTFDNDKSPASIKTKN